VSHLIALIFDDPFKGGEARTELHRMAGERFLTISDLALITKKLDGKSHVSLEEKPIGKGQQKKSHVAGLVAAAVAGTMPGTAGRELISRLMDHGITHRFVKNLKQELEPGTSALIILAGPDPDRRQKIAERLKDFDPKVLESELPAEVQHEIEREADDTRAA
jgi:uncharacterized membrane protein